MADNKILMNCTLGEVRCAFVENGKFDEFYVERVRDRSIVGNIYRGKVVRVLPGMQAAFVDIGIDKAAFLYVSDIYAEFQDLDFGDDDDGGDTGEKTNGSGKSRTRGRGRRPRPPRKKIEELLKAGQEILVQVTKEPIGTKGARITSHVTVAGRYLVLMPTIDRVGVSRRLDDPKKRRRMREIINENRPSGMGFILRTAAVGRSETEILRDMEFLLQVWREVGRNTKKAPCLLHKDLDLPLRVVRDMVDDDIKAVVVDDEKTHEQIRNFMRLVMPGSPVDLQLYRGTTPLFDKFGIEPEVDKLFQKKVWLKSGGYLIIDQNEALVSVDVNTGRYVGKSDLEDTILKTNVEAADELVTQLKLRSIGGIIVVDFIDMERSGNKEKLTKALQRALRSDRAKSHLLKISDLGLVEMTRKRTGESLARLLSEPCTYCEGRGEHKSRTTICYEIFREVIRKARNAPGATLVIEAHPVVADVLYAEERVELEELETDFEVRILIRPDTRRHIESFQIRAE